MYSIAIVGCGRISDSHVRAISSIKDFNVVALCDLDISKAIRVRTDYSLICQVYQDLADLIKNEQFDILVICTPSGLHPSHIRLAASKGCRNILTEKPIGVDWEDALRAVLVSEQCGINLWTVQQNRYNRTIKELKNCIDSGQLGAVYNISINVFWTRPQSYYDQASWRGTKKLDGGAILNQASHYLDLANFLFGDVEQVSGYCETFARKIESEDSAVSILKFKSGAIGTFNVSMLTYPKNIEGSIMLLSEKGTIKIGGQALNVVEIAETDSDVTRLKSSSYSIDNVYGVGHFSLYENVLKFLHGQECELVTGRESLKSLATILAIYKSSQCKSMVKVQYE